MTSQVDSVHQALATIPADYQLVAHLDRPAARRQTRRRTGGHMPETLYRRPVEHSGASKSRPPVSLDLVMLTDTATRYHGDDAEDAHQVDRMAGERRQGVLPQLWLWCRMVESEALESCAQLPDDLPEHPDVASCCSWLDAMADWSSTQPWFPEMAEDLTSLSRMLQDAIGDPRPYIPRHRKPEGCGDRFRPVRDESGAVAFYECAGCGATLNPWARLPDAEKDAGLVGLAELARRLGVPYDTAHTWLNRGQITPAVTEPRRLYDVDECASAVSPTVRDSHVHGSVIL